MQVTSGTQTPITGIGVHGLTTIHGELKCNNTMNMINLRKKYLSDSSKYF